MWGCKRELVLLSSLLLLLLSECVVWGCKRELVLLSSLLLLLLSECVVWGCRCDLVLSLQLITNTERLPTALACRLETTNKLLQKSYNVNPSQIESVKKGML